MPNRRKPYLALLLCLSLDAYADPKPEIPEVRETVAIDTRQISHEFLGFGTQIWAPELTPKGRQVLADLDIDYVRLSASSGLNTPGDPTPVDSSPEAMDRYIARQFDKNPTRLPATKAAFDFLKSQQIQTVLLIWQAPKEWQPKANQLLPQYLDDYARAWGSTLHYLETHGIRPDFIEIVNEPEGHWSTYVPPDEYNQLVKQVKRELQRRGLGDIGILGPGVGSQTGDKWPAGLDSEGRNALKAWSVHTYEGKYGGAAHNLAPFIAAVRNIQPQKPVYITEYSTKNTVFDGFVTRPNNDPAVAGPIKASYSDHYAVEVFQNTLALINGGANALFYWELGDHNWGINKDWGMIDRQGNPKPVYFALKTLYPRIPDHASVIKPQWQTHAITLSALKAQGKLIVAVANNTRAPVSATLNLSPPPPPGKLGYVSFEGGAAVQKNTAQLGQNRQIEIKLNPQSTLTLDIPY